MGYPAWCDEVPDLVDVLLTHGNPLPELSDANPLRWKEAETHIPISKDPLCLYASTKQFGPRYLYIRQDSSILQQSFHCGCCHQQPSVLWWDMPPRTQCQHWESCKECQTRLIGQLLRCGGCCRELTGHYPGCQEGCELISRRLGEGLSTSGCPRCGNKLAKDGCGRTCDRKLTTEYGTCHQRLQLHLAVMVLHPSMCALYDPTLRPCPHYSRCSTHGTISRGRSYPRCPQCRQET